MTATSPVSPTPTSRRVPCPPGSAGIERTLAGYLNLAGIRPADMPLGKASDYSPFLDAGRADRRRDHRCGRNGKRRCRRGCGVARRASHSTANNHLPGDTVDNVGRDALAVMGPGVAFAVGTYAQSIEGVNGVPTREQRRRNTP